MGFRILLLSFAAVGASPVPLFYKLANNITVVCPYAEIGAYGEIDGEAYLKVDRGLLNDFIANKRYNDLPNLCTSGITDMGFLFQHHTKMNADIRSWDVSLVENMNFMFFKAIAFNYSLIDWNIRSLKSDYFMFACAIAFYKSSQETKVLGWPDPRVKLWCFDFDLLVYNFIGLKADDDMVDDTNEIFIVDFGKESGQEVEEDDGDDDDTDAYNLQ